jgi:phosphatidylglycerophosphate synthase
MVDQSSWNINLKQADAAMSLKTWWALIFIYPLARPLTVFLVNKTNVSPNQVTLTAIFFRILTACCFFVGNHVALAFGAFLYLLAYVCDCTDGTVARIKRQSSELGRYLDHVADLVGDIIILIVLAGSQGLLSQPFIWGMVIFHMCESYISYLSGFSIKQNDGRLSDNLLFRQVNLYRNWWFKKNIKSFISFPDYTAVIFVFFPLFGMPQIGLWFGFYLLLIVLSYTIFSTFVSLHTNEKRFP